MLNAWATRFLGFHNRLRSRVVQHGMAPMHRRPGLRALALALFAPAVVNAAALQAMTEFTASSAATIIKVEQYTVSFTTAVSGTAFSYKTRGYNPSSSAMTDRMAVGPTLRASAGDTLKVTLDNDLSVNNAGEATTMNTLHSPGTTNLHTHGLHVDSDDPQDNVYVTVAPGATHDYQYSITPDHMGGTHWYHAHFHGNTALQVGNGLVGMIVIADAADAIPSDLAELTELVLMVQKLEPYAVQQVAVEYGAADEAWTSTSGLASTIDSFWTVNGQITPTATVTQNQWTRVRVAYSSLDAAVQIGLSDTNNLGCVWKLLAKDGIYVDNAPRTLTTAYVAPGNRFDFVVKCTSAGDFTLTATAEAAAAGGGGGGGPGGRKLLQTAEILMTFTVGASAATAAGDLTVFTPKKPVYLQDVYDETAHGVTHVAHTLTLARADGGYVLFCGPEHVYMCCV